MKVRSDLQMMMLFSLHLHYVYENIHSTYFSLGYILHLAHMNHMKPYFSNLSYLKLKKISSKCEQLLLKIHFNLIEKIAFSSSTNST